jgi:hypothetical protein
VRRRPGALVAAGAALVALAGLLSMPSASAESKSALAQVRQATTAYHDLAAAESAGYIKFLPCFDDPVEGGMGQHWALLSAIDDTIDARQPEVLVYEPRDGYRNGGYKLVAVEYVVPQSDKWSDDNPPMLFGEHYHRNDSLGIWALHAWVWHGNPSGAHADFAPNVRACPAGT